MVFSIFLLITVLGLIFWIFHVRKQNTEIQKKSEQEIQQLKKEITDLNLLLGKSYRDYKTLKQNTVEKAQFFHLQKECHLLTQQCKSSKNLD